MNQYKIYYNSRKKYQDAYEAVKLGWNWSAFIFNAFWAFSKNMSNLGIGVIIVILICNGFIDTFLYRVHAELLFSVILIISIIFGIYGNLLLEKNLISQKYKYKSIVMATNKDGAITAFMEKESNSSNPDPKKLKEISQLPTDVSIHQYMTNDKADSQLESIRELVGNGKTDSKIANNFNRNSIKKLCHSKKSSLWTENDVKKLRIHFNLDKVEARNPEDLPPIISNNTPIFIAVVVIGAVIIGLMVKLINKTPEGPITKCITPSNGYHQVCTTIYPDGRTVTRN